MGSLSIWHWLIVLVILTALLFWPVFKIVKRTGNNGGMAVIVAILMIVFAPAALWLLAVMSWPAVDGGSQRDKYGFHKN